VLARIPWLWAAALLWASFLGATVGCSWLLDPESEPPRCVRAEGMDDPCPAGRACVEGRCLPIFCQELEICGDHIDNDCDGRVDERNDPSVEICGNRLDDDCDGEIDELADPNIPEICGNGIDDDCDGLFDEGHDQDGDGVPWCGDATVPDGAMQADCNDYDPDVRPGLPEVCDGLDNDCDGRVDEATDTPLCPSGYVCAGQRCVKPDCTLAGSSAGCGDGQVCDPALRTCVPRGCTPDSCPGRVCDLTSGECRDVREAIRRHRPEWLRSRPDLAARFPLILTCAKDTHFCETQHRNVPSLRRRAPDRASRIWAPNRRALAWAAAADCSPPAARGSCRRPSRPCKRATRRRNCCERSRCSNQ
jgi:hypothetical protein